MERDSEEGELRCSSSELRSEPSTPRLAGFSSLRISSPPSLAPPVASEIPSLPLAPPICAAAACKLSRLHLSPTIPSELRPALRCPSSHSEQPPLSKRATSRRALAATARAFSIDSVPRPACPPPSPSPRTWVPPTPSYLLSLPLSPPLSSPPAECKRAAS